MCMAPYNYGAWQDQNLEVAVKLGTQEEPLLYLKSKGGSIPSSFYSI
jgi:hypothetical protein